MTGRTHYRHAPITEAIIDLRTTHAQDFSADDLGMIREAIADRYPNQEPMFLYSGQMYIGEPGDPIQAETAHERRGISFTSQNKQQILQARIDGFTFSTLAPYDRWESFRGEAYRLWELYRPAAKVEGVTRAAVRYINRIDIPKVGTVQLDDYLRTYPQISADMPQEGLIGTFFMQIQSWQKDLDCELIINEAPARPPNEETTSIRLDLDLFRERFTEPWRSEDDEAVWGFLEQLHDRKNEVFEASITEETRRLIR
jgi:uncharacterized protein (TIGR04255 family)